MAVVVAFVFSRSCFSRKGVWCIQYILSISSKSFSHPNESDIFSVLIHTRFKNAFASLCDVVYLSRLSSFFSSPLLPLLWERKTKRTERKVMAWSGNQRCSNWVHGWTEQYLLCVCVCPPNLCVLSLCVCVCVHLYFCCTDSNMCLCMLVCMLRPSPVVNLNSQSPRLSVHRSPAGVLQLADSRLI